MQFSGKKDVFVSDSRGGFLTFYKQMHTRIITARKRSLGQGNIFTPVCHSVHTGGVCVVAPGGACVVLFGGACVVLFGGRVWFYLGGGVHGFSGGHVWFFWRGGMRGFFSFFGYNEIRSMSGRYASCWNAFLFQLCL